MVKKISQNEFNEVTASEVAVIDFSATWCGPCKMLAPVLEEVSEEYAGKVNFFNVDVDENPDLAMQYKIMNIPALVVLKKGEKVDTQVGFAPKENIVEFIKKQYGKIRCIETGETALFSIVCSIKRNCKKVQAISG